MGTYVYSLRKKHVEAKLDGIYPIDVIAYQYAYKESYPRQGEYGYVERQCMAGRVASLAKKARQHYLDRAKEEFGTIMRDFYFANGGLEDGSLVYKMFQWLPTAHYDDRVPATLEGSPAEQVGRLFKVGRGQWIVSDTCPEHRWFETCLLADQLTPAYQCERCDTMKVLLLKDKL
jgi:hypothetical protein